jgi:hypothetical protein
MTSVPGDPDTRFEALPGSPLPDQLRDNGYEVSEVGTTQRILPHAIEDKYVIGTGGVLELATAASTQPITRTVSHAGVVTTTAYQLRVPAVPPDQGTRIASRRRRSLRLLVGRKSPVFPSGTWQPVKTPGASWAILSNNRHSVGSSNAVRKARIAFCTRSNCVRASSFVIASGVDRIDRSSPKST